MPHAPAPPGHFECTTNAPDSQPARSSLGAINRLGANRLERASPLSLPTCHTDKLLILCLADGADLPDRSRYWDWNRVALDAHSIELREGGGCVSWGSCSDLFKGVPVAFALAAVL